MARSPAELLIYLFKNLAAQNDAVFVRHIADNLIIINVGQIHGVESLGVEFQNSTLVGDVVFLTLHACTLKDWGNHNHSADDYHTDCNIHAPLAVLRNISCKQAANNHNGQQPCTQYAGLIAVFNQRKRRGLPLPQHGFVVLQILLQIFTH